MDEASNESTFNVSYFVRNADAEMQAAEARIQAKAVAIGAVLTSGPVRVGSSEVYYSFANFGAVPAVIYSAPGGAYIVYGDIFLSYSLMGMHTSWIGFPVSDEYQCNIFFRCSNFTGGYIIWDLFTKATPRGYQ